MKKPLYYLFLSLVIFSCSVDKKNTETASTASNDSTNQSEIVVNTDVDSIKNDINERKDLQTTFDSLLKYFEKVNTETLTFKIKANNDTNTSYSTQEEISFGFQSFFEGHLYPKSRTSTGYLPKNYYQINDSLAFLIVFIQDDYGPVYHGLVCNTVTERIINSQILARVWGDAGDSQTIFSELTLEYPSLEIKKYINTCHAELDFDSEPVKVISEDCSDSTYVATIK